MSAVAATGSALLRVCSTSDVPLGEGRSAMLDGRRIAVFHTPTGWYAIDGVCPHRGGPLADGLVADRCVTCPLHDRRFDLATGTSTDGEERVTAYRVVLDGDDVLVAL